MRRFQIVLAILPFLCCSCSMYGRASLGHPDEMFLINAASDAVAEVALAELAIGRTHREDVRAFAERLSRDHSSELQQLKRLALLNHLDIPEEPGECQEVWQLHLAKVPAEQFEREFMGLIIANHAMSSAMFEHSAQTTQNAEIRRFAENELRVLHQHHSTAKQIWSSILSSKPM